MGAFFLRALLCAGLMAGASGFLAGPALPTGSRLLRSQGRSACAMKAEDSSSGEGRRAALQTLFLAAGAAVLPPLPASAALAPQGRSERTGPERSVPLGGREARRGPEGVNRPDLLPEGEKVNVIDLEKILTKGQANKMDKLLAKLEVDTGYKLRVLCQRYPETPGLAIKEYWGIDDKTIVMVVDRGNSKSGSSNILNFNVGGGVDLALPSSTILNFNVGGGVDLALPSVFFTRLRNFFGNSYYIRDYGEDVAVINTVDTIVGCLRDGFCIDVPDAMKKISAGTF
ncbi:hypothetical protein T484DRAFT_1908386 [Baffinella frigidus]|nr:hypothetical protein T484DRAFT_1908386 [Cryptophyta sp. CCMP2293]